MATIICVQRSRSSLTRFQTNPISSSASFHDGGRTFQTGVLLARNQTSVRVAVMMVTSFQHQLSFALASSLFLGSVRLEIFDWKKTNEETNEEFSESKSDADQPQLPSKTSCVHELAEEFNSNRLETNDESKDHQELLGAIP